MDSIVKWDYEIIDATGGQLEKLKELGAQGWEAFAGTSGGKILLKRPYGEISITKHISQERNSVSYDGYER